MEDKNQNDYIDLREVVVLFIRSWRFILKVVAVFIVIGLIFAFGTTPEFTSYSKIVLEEEAGADTSLGSLSSLAGLAGINLNSAGGGTIPPEMYNEVISSLPFIIDLMNHEIYFSLEEKTYSSLEYFSEEFNPGIMPFIIDYTVKLPYKIIELFKSDEEKPIAFKNGLYSFSKTDFEIIESFRERINVEIDAETGSILLSTYMPDPVASAELNKECLKRLQTFIIEFKINRAKEELGFLKSQYEESNVEYLKKQKKLAKFIEQNQNITSEIKKLELQGLRNEYDLAFSIIKGISTQVEQAKVAVKKATPIYTVLNPPSIPVEKSKPKRGIMLFLFAFFGGFSSIVYLFIKNFYL